MMMMMMGNGLSMSLSGRDDLLLLNIWDDMLCLRCWNGMLPHTMNSKFEGPVLGKHFELDGTISKLYKFKPKQLHVDVQLSTLVANHLLKKWIPQSHLASSSLNLAIPVNSVWRSRNNVQRLEVSESHIPVTKPLLLDLTKSEVHFILCVSFSMNQRMSYLA
jgi:hypothetical protein